VDEYLSEKEQVQLIKKWWKENGSFVIAGLVLGIGGLAGWNYWKSYKLSQAEAAGAVYESLVAAVGKGDPGAAAGDLETLVSDYGATPYLDQGRLMMARLLVEQGDFQAAVQQLDSVVASTSDPELERVARMRLARVLLAAGDDTRALEVLDLTRAGAFAARFHEIRGDVLVSRGEAQAAFEEYQQALDDPTEGVIDSQAVRLKMETLGIAPAGEAATEPSGDV
jgi:predicted negative regulator of RcsB-dependent stress response